MSKSNSTPWIRSNKTTGKQTWYYTTAEGKQVSLKEDYKNKDAAYKKWHEICANQTENPKNNKLDLKSLIAEWTIIILSLMTPQRKKTALTQINALFSHSKCKSPAEIKNQHVMIYLNSNAALADSTKINYRKYIKCFFDWLVEYEYLQKSPLKARCGWTQESRGEKVVIEQQDFETFLKHARGRYKDLCELMWHCGARPKELRLLQIEEVDFNLAIIDKTDHKTRKKNKIRQILLNDTAVQILGRVIGNRTSGFVFLSKLAKPYGPANFNERWTWIRRQANLPSTLIPYSCRHSFAVRHLLAGVPDVAVASMMGHSSTAILHKHYSHLLAKVKSFRHHLL